MKKITYFWEHYIVSIFLTAHCATYVNLKVSYRPLASLVRGAENAEFQFLFPFC